MNPRYVLLLLATVSLSTASAVFATDFFSISSIQYEPPSLGNAGGRLKVRVQTAEATRSSQVIAKAYIFDDKEKMVASWSAPMDVVRGNDHYPISAILQKEKPEDIYFGVPANLSSKHWIGLVVFGDKNGAVAKGYGGNLSALILYPEKNLVENRSGRMVQRKAAIDPLVETVVTIPSPEHPQMTLFFRMPAQVSRVEDLNGVLALCVLAHRVGDIQRELQGADHATEMTGLLRFADTHKLGILGWGNQRLSNGSSSQSEKARELDSLTEAWEHGVMDLHAKYNIPIRDYLVWGECRASYTVQNLVLRKPDYFLAAFIHNPPEFDSPTPGGGRVLWLLTSGELDPGYPESIKYYRRCRSMNYPIIFKPIVGLTHLMYSTVSYNLAYKFFEYALSLKQQRHDYDIAMKDPLAPARIQGATSPIWATGFRNPNYYGDYLNQECYPVKQADFIPVNLRVPLPTKELADLWNK